MQQGLQASCMCIWIASQCYAVVCFVSEAGTSKICGGGHFGVAGALVAGEVAGAHRVSGVSDSSDRVSCVMQLPPLCLDDTACVWCTRVCVCAAVVVHVCVLSVSLALVAV